MKNLLVSLATLVWIVTLVSPIAATGIAPGTDTAPTADSPTPDLSEVSGDGPRYATGFTYEAVDDFTLVTVTMPWQGAASEDTVRYVLYPRGSAAPSGYDDALAVEVPVRSVVTMSTTFLPHLEQLDAVDTIVGHDALAWVYSPAVRARAAAGMITEVGSGAMVDIERTLLLNPDIIFTNSYGGDWDASPALQRAGLPTAVAGDWVEQSPLGRAEWLLFTALFLDKLEVALELFHDMETEYLSLASLAESVDRRPKVLINAPYQGTWSVAGGGSYAAQFIHDAGGEYVWSHDTSTGALFLDFEAVYAEAGDADVWINPGLWSSLADGQAEDGRFEQFASFAESAVFNNNARVSDSGGVDYFESGAANPHIVLKDLIWAFHPEIVPGYEPFYYQKLE